MKFLYGCMMLYYDYKVKHNEVGTQKWNSLIRKYNYWWGKYNKK